MDLFDEERQRSGLWLLRARVGLPALVLVFDLIAAATGRGEHFAGRVWFDLGYVAFNLVGLLAALRWARVRRGAWWFVVVDVVALTAVQAWMVHLQIALGIDPVRQGMMLGVTYALFAALVAASQLSLDRGVVVSTALASLAGALVIGWGVAGEPMGAVFGGTAIGLCFVVGLYFPTRVPELVQAAAERMAAERLLDKLLPSVIAQELKGADEGTSVARSHDEVSILFADIVGFTQLTQSVPPREMVETLDALFSAFDELADRHGVERIRTIGDNYMAACGVPEPRDEHAGRLVQMGLDMLAVLEREDAPGGGLLRLRVGIATGPVVGAVVGRSRYQYDIWGDAVNRAARLESSGEPGRVHIGPETRTRLGGRYQLEERAGVALKGMGEMTTWFVVGS